MKEATGEVSMTLVTIVAVGVIGSILAFFWDDIQVWINQSIGGAMGNTGQNVTDQTNR